MKKTISLIIAGILLICSLSACADRTASDSPKNNTIQIVTTIFPEYDWVENILGDNPANVEVTNKDMITINLLDVLGDKIKEEEIKEGMENDEEENEEDDEEEPEYDEHVWLSLKNAQVLVSEIAERLAEIDGDNAAVYTANANAYNEQLAKLDSEYQEIVDSASTDTLLFGDRFPFRYLVDDYGLEYYAAFVGCSAESEASFETIMFLANKVDELSLHTIMTIEGTDHSIAEAIRSNTAYKDQQILTLDSMQGTTSQGVADGTTYLSVMENNLTVLKKALE